jgi:hypothetical protein
VLVALALLLVGASSDTPLSQVAASETAQTDLDSGEAYCRGRRDFQADWEPCLSEADEPTVILIAPPALIPGVALRPHFPPCPTMEHQSLLTRRTRAPG